MLRIPSAALVVACALAIVVAPVSAQSLVYESDQGPFRAVTVVDDVQEPWSFAFLPGGDMLITEKPGRLRIFRNGALLPDPVAGVPNVRYEGQGGLLDVILHPDFESNQLIYLSFSKPNEDESQSTTAVVRGRLEEDQLHDVEEIFEAEAWSDGAGHYGSRLAFDADGYLFVTVGDRMAPPQADALESHPAQDLSNHQGTVNRLHDDGRIPSDNPFVDQSGALPSIWTYGHRSPQGLVVHPETGDVWETEHGPQGGDELNLLLPGQNYGWPVIGYGVNYGGAPLHAAREREGMEQPVQHFTPSIATSGLMIYSGDRFPEWQGSAFMGGLANPQIARLPLIGDDARQVGRLESPPLLLGIGRVRDIREGPDGLVYVAIEDREGDRIGRIVRLEPVDDDR